jgi:hypothetical protein
MKLTSKVLIQSALALFFVGATQVASATVLNFTLTSSTNQVIDSFTLDSSAGRTDGMGTPPYVLFDITNDLLGYNGVFFGDSSVNGWFGIGPIVSGNIVSQVISEYFSPALYAGIGYNINVMAGSSYTATSGNVLTVSAVPEPETYAMMLAGLGLIGFIAYRRKSDSSIMFGAT